MTITNKLYSNFPVNLLKKNCGDLSSVGVAVKAALVSSSYAFDQEAHNDFADVTNELTGGVGGYTSGGAALATKAVSEATRVTTYDADDVQWASATFTARGCVIYDASTGVAGTSPLVCFIDFGGNYTSTNGTFKIVWDAAGIFTMTVAA